MNRSLWILLLSLLLLAKMAQATEGVNVQNFNPSTSDHFVFIEDALLSEWPKQPKYRLGINYNLVSAPLVALDSSGTKRQFNYIDSIQTLDLFLGYDVTKQFALFFAAPGHFITFPSTPGAVGLSTGSDSSLGDLKVMGKVRVTDDMNPFGIAFIPEIHFPTGNTADFVSDGSVYLSLRMALERKFESVTINANLGYASAQNALYAAPTLTTGIDYRQRFIFGLGLFAPLNDRFGLNLEFSRLDMLPLSQNLNPNEIYGGIRVVASEGIIFTAGGSIGKISGPSGVDYRLVAGFRFTAYGEDEKPMSNLEPVSLDTPYTGASGYSSPPPVTSKAAPQSQIVPQTVPQKNIRPARPLLAHPIPPPVAAKTAAQANFSRAKPSAKNNIKPTGTAAVGLPSIIVLKGQNIELATPIDFAKKSDHLSLVAKESLDSLAEFLVKNKNTFKKIVIQGSSDSDLLKQNSKKLALNRAASVKKYLVRQKIPEKILVVRAAGKKDGGSKGQIEFFILK